MEPTENNKKGKVNFNSNLKSIRFTMEETQKYTFVFFLEIYIEENYTFSYKKEEERV